MELLLGLNALDGPQCLQTIQEARQAAKVVESVDVEPGKEGIARQLLVNLVNQASAVIAKQVIPAPEGSRHPCPTGKLEGAADAEACSHGHQFPDGDRARYSNPDRRLDTALADCPDVTADRPGGKAHLRDY